MQAKAMKIQSHAENACSILRSECEQEMLAMNSKLTEMQKQSSCEIAEVKTAANAEIAQAKYTYELSLAEVRSAMQSELQSQHVIANGSIDDSMNNSAIPNEEIEELKNLLTQRHKELLKVELIANANSEELSAKAVSLTNNIDRIYGEYCNVESYADTLKSELTVFTSNSGTQVQQTNYELTIANKRLETLKDESQKEIANLKSQVIAHEVKLCKFQDIAEKQHATKVEELKLEAQKHLETTLQQTMAPLREENEGLKAKIAEYEEAIKSQEKLLASNDVQSKVSDENIFKLKRQLASEQELHEGAKQQIQELQTTIEQKQTNASADTTNADRDKLYEELKKEIEELKNKAKPIIQVKKEMNDIKRIIGVPNGSNAQETTADQEEEEEREWTQEEWDAWYAEEETYPEDEDAEEEGTSPTAKADVFEKLVKVLTTDKFDTRAKEADVIRIPQLPTAAIQGMEERSKKQSVVSVQISQGSF